MSYCVNSDVLKEFKNLQFNSGTVSVAYADQFIAEADEYIDGRIGVKYVTPVTGTKSLTILRNISVWLVADRIADILKLKTGKQDIQQLEVREESLRDKANAMLKAIVGGTLLLSDATLAKSNDGVQSFSYDNDEEHTFKKNENQW